MRYCDIAILRYSVSMISRCVLSLVLSLVLGLVLGLVLSLVVFELLEILSRKLSCSIMLVSVFAALNRKLILMSWTNGWPTSTKLPSSTKNSSITRHWRHPKKHWLVAEYYREWESSLQKYHTQAWTRWAAPQTPDKFFLMHQLFGIGDDGIATAAGTLVTIAIMGPFFSLFFYPLRRTDSSVIFSNPLCGINRPM